MCGARTMRKTIVLAVTVTVALLAAAAGCPLGCTCKWKGGKQTVECVNKSLSAIPGGIDAGTQVLDMSGNPVDALSRGRFLAAGLSNLQKIFMARCRIEYVDDAAFRGLSNLVELDLSDNAIAEIPTKSFDDYPLLMKLVLSGNALTAIHAAAFKRLGYLTVLDLSRCRLSAVEPGAFDGLRSLEWLRLDHNRIARIESVAGSAVLPLSLHGIEMHDNPWTCDCRLRDVHRWLNDNAAPHTVEPACHWPDRLRGSAIRKLAADELACAPHAAAASPVYVVTDAGKNVTLTCALTPAGVEARVSWWFEGRPAANGTANGTELSIEDAGPADNGTYACVAENRAGRAACNFTVRVVQEPSEMAAGSYPPDAPTPAVLTLVLVVGSALLVTFAVLCAVTCRVALSLVTKRRRRRRGRDGKADGAAADDPAGGQTMTVGQSDSTNLTTVSSTVDGKLSSAEDMSAYGEYDVTAYEAHEVLRAGGDYDAYRATVADAYRATATDAVDAAAAAVADAALDANPDLISDASTAVRDNTGDYRREGEAYKIAVQPSGGREFWPVVYPYELSSGGLAAAGEPYPADYGLPKLSPYPPPPSLYRTLPNRRNAARPQGRSCQEAEFVLLHQHHHLRNHPPPPQQQQQQHRRQTRYEPQNVRYNQQGYPYPEDAAYCATASAAGFYGPPSLSNASAQTLDEETMMMMMMTTIPPPATASPAVVCSRQPPVAAEQQHKAVTSVQKQSANTESPDEGYVGEGPDS